MLSKGEEKIISEERKRKTTKQFVEKINEFCENGFMVETSRVMTRLYEDANKATIWCSFDMKKEKDDYVECPMEFEQLGRMLGIKLGKRQSLSYSINHSVWKVVEFNNPIRTKISKTPTPPEDLEVGKWYYCTDSDDISETNYTHRYHLYLGEGKYANTSRESVIISNMNWNNWYEVVEDEY